MRRDPRGQLIVREGAVHTNTYMSNRLKSYRNCKLQCEGVPGEAARVLRKQKNLRWGPGKVSLVIYPASGGLSGSPSQRVWTVWYSACGVFWLLVLAEQ
ncbi:unnamed protein product [Urochloa humidicola]